MLENICLTLIFLSFQRIAPRNKKVSAGTKTPKIRRSIKIAHANAWISARVIFGFCKKCSRVNMLMINMDKKVRSFELKNESANILGLNMRNRQAISATLWLLK